MAAPSETKWGSIVKGSTDGRQGKLGIYTKITNTDTQTTVNVQVWFATIYTCTDSNNTFYYNVGTSVTSASTSQGSFTIKHTVDSKWNSSNQTKILDKTYTYTRGTSATTYKVYAKLANIDMLNGTVYANTTYTVPALASYTVSYNANGGSGAPGNQTKWYGKSLTLSSTKPTRTGYSFQGWALTKANADDGSVYYQAGATCGRNENLTLYAVWKANTYIVKYDANGGTGAPGNQTKTYGVNLTLSSTTPTRKNYNFLGWGTAATATAVSYKAGGLYTANAAVTLYAVWELAYVEPRITDLTVYRCVDANNMSDAGESIFVSFGWTCDQTTKKVSVEFESLDGTIVHTTSKSLLSGNSGSFVELIDDYKFSTDSTYICRVTVEDAGGSTVMVRTINGAKYIIDILAEGKGIAFNKPAELEGVMDIAFQVRLAGGLLYMVLEPETDLNDITTPGFYVGANVSTYSYTHCPLTSGTFTLEVKSSGPSGQVQQCLTLCDKKKSQAFERFYYGGDWPKDSSDSYIWTGEWIYPTLGSEFAMYGTDVTANKAKYRKDGRIVEVRGIVTPVNDIAGDTTMHTIFTLADGYRPNSPIYTICQGSGNSTWLLRVNPDGGVSFSRYRNGDTSTKASAGAWLPFQVTFLTN